MRTAHEQGPHGGEPQATSDEPLRTEPEPACHPHRGEH